MIPSLSAVNPTIVGAGVGSLLGAISLSRVGKGTLSKSDLIKATKLSLAGGIVAGGVWWTINKGITMSEMSGSTNYIKIGAAGGAALGLAVAMQQNRLDDARYLLISAGGGSFIGVVIGGLVNYKDLL